MSDIPCQCGHLEKKHIDLDSDMFGCEICFDQWMNTFNPTTDDWYCETYKPDNLMYVEQLAKQKGLV